MRLRWWRGPLAAVAGLAAFGPVYAAALRWLPGVTAWASAHAPFRVGQDLVGQLSEVGPVGLALAAATLAGKLAWEGLTRLPAFLPPGSAVSRAAVDEAAADLAVEVARRMRRETIRRDVWRGAPLEVVVRATERPVQADRRVVLAGAARGTRLRLSSGSKDLATLFRGLPRGHLTVLGEAGAGKTVLAMRLTLDLLDARPPRADGPVPVYLPMSSWNPHQVSLDDWMAARLVEDYAAVARRHGAGVLRRLVETARILPILDGMDEVTRAPASEVIKGVDSAFTDRMPFVLTCRPAEFEYAVRTSEKYLSRAAVVEIEPVRADTAAAYLHGAVGDVRRWRRLLDRLRAEPDGPLATALTTPLMLFLIRTTYESTDTDPGELLDTDRFGTSRAVEEHLLDAFVPAAYDTRHKPPYRAERAQRWLGTLAHGPRELRWWNLVSEGATLWIALALSACAGWLNHLILGPFFGFFFGVCSFLLYLKVDEWLGYRGSEIFADDRETGIRSHLRRYRILATGCAMTAAIAVGGLVGAALGGGLGADQHTTRAYAAGIGLLFGITTLLDSAWGSFFLTRITLALSGGLPLRLMRFLEDAHQRGVLRQPGAAYQFRHARLQDRIRRQGPNLFAGRWYVAGTPASRLRAFGRLLRRPLLRLALQVGLVVMPAFAFAAIPTVDNLRFQAGAKPRVVDRSMCGGGGACIHIVDWHWELPPGAAVTTEFETGSTWLMPQAYGGVNGDIDIDGCPTAVVEISMTAGGSTAALSHILPGDEEIDLGDLSGWPLPKRLEAVTVTFRRHDTTDCTADLVWTNPALDIDQIFKIKDYFTEPGSDADGSAR
ncbi:NACHT domain-containing protein [Catellatospora sp. NPDC049609]|uniref:NACHT domain-containing protein n=1 Tax=Catellatospora sp. NPDC049609 TaxID=3155505 RepID=UPI003430BEAC